MFSAVMSESPAPEIQVVPIEQVKLNPGNPRLIHDNRFEQLVQSLIAFPQMLHLRPIVVNEQGIVLGGNMRLHAALRLSYKEVPIIVAAGLTEAEQREFVVKDNASFGEWDYNVLANEWSDLPLEAWGINLPADWLSEPEEASQGGLGSDDGPRDGEPEAEEKPCSLTITFESPEQLQAAESDIQELIDREYPGATCVIQVGMRNG
jgi:hypothetical protein